MSTNDPSNEYDWNNDFVLTPETAISIVNREIPCLIQIPDNYLVDSFNSQELRLDDRDARYVVQFLSGRTNPENPEFHAIRKVRNYKSLIVLK